MNLQTPAPTTTPQWLPGPRQPRLAEGEVHVWLADLAGRDLAATAALLCVAEHKRSLRFHQPVARDRYIHRRGLLRMLLGRYLGRDGANVEIIANTSGKPSLPPEGDDAWLRFNLSGSQDLCLLVFARGRDVGVDIEAIDTSADVEPLAARLLTPAEGGWWRSLPPAQRIAAFHELWARKEACVKCTGEGVGINLTRIETGLTQPLPHGATPGVTARCNVIALHTRPGYAAALSVDSPTPRVQRWQV